MAMTLRLNDELDKKLAAVAARTGLSKQQLVVQALVDYVTIHEHRATVLALAERAAADYPETLRRLGE